MAVGLKERNFGTLVLIVLLGILVGSYLSLLVGLIPVGTNVAKTFFTHNFISFGAGYPNALCIDLSVIKFQIGFDIKLNLFSIIGVFVSLYLFRWYK